MRATIIHTAYDILFPQFQNRVHQNEPLASHCAFGVGGLADIWVSLASHQELEALIRVCATHQWPLLVVGEGRNVIFADEGVHGIVARLDLQNYEVDPQGDGTATLIAEAGVRWPKIAHVLGASGWAGLEFGIGIPGTLGAGLISNAGAHNQELGQALEWIEVLDARSCNTENYDTFVPLVRQRYLREDLDLSYRHSRFRMNRYTHLDEQSKLIFPERHLIEPAEIVTKLGLRLRREDPQQLADRIHHYTQERRTYEPLAPKTGSIFKDTPEHRAQDLIAQAGLQGKTLGKAQVNEHNANYITNTGGATARDILSLIVEVHRQVLAHSGINLALNVEILGEWPERKV
jgi:UDP-N-acetylmuramate dehydrogenase